MFPGQFDLLLVAEGWLDRQAVTASSWFDKEFIFPTAHVGAAAPTLGALTSSSAGNLTIVGAFSATLGALSSGAAGAITIVGDLARTLGALTVSSLGGAPIFVIGDITLDAVSITADGRVEVAGALTITLEDAIAQAVADRPRRHPFSSVHVPIALTSIIVED